MTTPMTGPILPNWQALLPGGSHDNTPPPLEQIEVAPAPLEDSEAQPIEPGTTVDGGQLQQDLVQALGRDVAITATPPTDTKPGQLRITDSRTGIPLRVDPDLVARVLSEHAPAEDTRTQFLREFDTATSVEAKLDAVRDYIARQAEDDVRAQHLRQQARARVSPRTAASQSGTVRPPPPPRITSRNPWTRRAQREQWERQQRGEG